MGTITTTGNGAANGGNVTVQVQSNGGTLTMGAINADRGTSGTGGTVQITGNQAGALNIANISSVGGFININQNGAGVLTTKSLDR